MKTAMRLWLILACVFAMGLSARAAQDPSQYTFSWPLGDGAFAPRGGTTRGAPVTLETVASPAWQALQEPSLSPFERDRRAILALAGEYRVTFDFLEVTVFTPDGKRSQPYQSWATEKVYVDIDEGTLISLLHVLEMRFVQEDGSLSEPMVSKHWRQDWQYEPSHIIEYHGGNRWMRRAVAPADARGAWSQSVYEIDEGPRYASVARWEHSPSFSTWLSDETWRPLPTREARVRKDYHVLIGTNRITVQPTSWLHEENNLKTALTNGNDAGTKSSSIAREYGLARYERIRDTDFAAADRHYQDNRKRWQEDKARAPLSQENSASGASDPNKPSP